MGYFTDDRKMYVPLSIDTVEARKGNYFLSNKKMFFAVMLFLPIFIPLAILMDIGAGWIPLIIVAGIYMLIYFYVARFLIFEEKRLRKMVRELDDNKVSGIEHFWEVDKIGGGKEDDGTIYYSFKGSATGTTRGLVVMMDRGSVIGVPKGHYKTFRRTKEQFLRRLHLSGLDVQWYEMQKRPELQSSLIDHANKLSNLDNKYLQTLLKLQLNINTVYSMGDQQRYVDYVVVKREKHSKDFKRVLQTIIEETLGQNDYFVNPHIANKNEVEEFYKNYLMMDTIDSDNIRKSVDIKPFENFAKVIRMLDETGKEIPIEHLDDLDVDSVGGRHVDKEINKEKQIEKDKENKNKRDYDSELERLNKIRNRDRITHDEYEKRKEQMDEVYENSENFLKDYRMVNKNKGKNVEKENKEDKREEQKEQGPVMHEFKEDDIEVKGDASIEDMLRNKRKNEGKEKETENRDENDGEDENEEEYLSIEDYLRDREEK